jgi:uncharacterized damage-inducible protein DinB
MGETMSTVAAYLDKFEYDDWANRRALESLRATARVSERGRKLLAHIVGAQYVWISRIEAGEPLTDAWPELGLTEIEARLEWLRGTWGMLLDQANDAKLDDPVSYANFAGQQFSTPLRQILDHLIFHGAYHRGQIASVIRAEGGTPINTDYIQFTRR